MACKIGMKTVVRKSSKIKVPAKGYHFVAGKPCPVKGAAKPKKAKKAKK